MVDTSAAASSLVTLLSWTWEPGPIWCTPSDFQWLKCSCWLITFSTTVPLAVRIL
ncbi:hypothetical protein ACFQV2_33880 [Actinokineospora soli]|uniref:Uncharacterized protein n=1 Tax=Actinokineospora soli TaxID=1048753 RepID=A0ABW2TXN6_9PSEU